jgi:hypothetical protein
MNIKNYWLDRSKMRKDLLDMFQEYITIRILRKVSKLENDNGNKKQLLVEQDKKKERIRSREKQAS